jgi:hypothetical protein
MKHSTHDLVLGGGFVLLAVLGSWLAMGRPIVILALGLLVAFAVWAARGAGAGAPAPGLLAAYLAGLAVMAAHVGEEYLTGFQHRFPALFGFDWSDGRFLAFNGTWLAVFALAGLGLRRRVALAYLVAWFFALIGGIANGVGHLLLCLWQGGYFPGALTAPLCLIVGILIARRLPDAGTAPAAAP